jgi:uncharacterized delta-60 repeat protein
LQAGPRTAIGLETTCSTAVRVAIPLFRARAPDAGSPARVSPPQLALRPLVTTLLLLTACFPADLPRSEGAPTTAPSPSAAPSPSPTVEPGESSPPGAPGDLDASFGGDGWETTDLGQVDRAQDVAIQADGKIVVAGWTQTPGSADFAVARYNADGTLDGSFGEAGKVTTSLSGRADKAFAVAVQPDGAIVVAGFTWSDLQERRAFGLVRYASDGAVDTTFGTDGLVVTNLTPRVDRAAAVAIRNERIVVAGTVYPGDFAVARYKSDGSLDTSFSGDGIQTVDFDGARDIVRGLALQASGMIVVSGSSNRRVAVARLTRDGRLDREFSGDGRTTTDAGGGWAAGGGGLALQPDGKIVVSGTASGIDFGEDFLLVRFNRDGELDPSFSEDGIQRVDVGGCYGLDFGTDVAIQADGGIVEVGSTGDPGSFSLCLALARVQPDGGLDRRFGDKGKVIAPIATLDEAEAVALQADGRIVLVGSTITGDADRPRLVDFLVARFVP